MEEHGQVTIKEAEDWFLCNRHGEFEALLKACQDLHDTIIKNRYRQTPRSSEDEQEFNRILPKKSIAIDDCLDVLKKEEQYGKDWLSVFSEVAIQREWKPVIQAIILTRIKKAVILGDYYQETRHPAFYNAINFVATTSLWVLSGIEHPSEACQQIRETLSAFSLNQKDEIRFRMRGIFYPLLAEFNPILPISELKVIEARLEHAQESLEKQMPENNGPTIIGDGNAVNYGKNGHAESNVAKSSGKGNAVVEKADGLFQKIWNWIKGLF